MMGGKEFRYPVNTPAAEIPSHLEKYVITVSTYGIRMLDVKLSSDGTIMLDDREAIRKEFHRLTDSPRTWLVPDVLSGVLVYYLFIFEIIMTLIATCHDNQ
jgi:hypothetical protein